MQEIPFTKWYLCIMLILLSNIGVVRDPVTPNTIKGKAKKLVAGRLRGIRIPTIEQEQLMRAKRRVQVQIRMRLHHFGMFPTHIQRVIQIKDVEELLRS
jgi:hypothetical protein